jgi:alpha-galactosidase
VRRVLLNTAVAVVLMVATQAGCGAPPPDTGRAGLLTAPPMGWNSWNSGVDLTERNVESVIDAMVSSGMRDAGYTYVNLDAGWAAPTRDSRGHLTPDPVRFPDGIAAVAAYAHSRGMRLGLYASPYDEGCSAQPALASAGHEDADAGDFAAWGVDFLKYDWCRDKADHDTEVAVFTRMGDALRATGRRIVYSINPNSSGDHTAGARYDWSGIADMARTGPDLVPVWRETIPAVGPLDPFSTDVFLGVPAAFGAAAAAVGPSKPGFWSDPDMLVAGLGWDQFVTAHFAGIRNGLTLGAVPPDRQSDLAAVTAMSDDELAHRLLAQPNLSTTEQQAHLSLWAMLSAPLIAGNDVRSMTPQTRDLLTNREVIAVDQDPAAKRPVPTGADDRILGKALSDGSVAVAFVNTGDVPADLATTARAVGLPAASCYAVRDLWAHRDATSTGPLAAGSVAPHAVTLLRVAPGCG